MVRSEFYRSLAREARSRRDRLPWWRFLQRQGFANAADFWDAAAVQAERRGRDRGAAS